MLARTCWTKRGIELTKGNWSAQKVGVDVALFLLIFLSIFYVSQQITEHYKSEGVKFQFYQAYYEPAVRVACGYDFGGEKNSADWSPALRDFLITKADSLTCDQVPPYRNYDPAPPASIWFSLLVFVGWLWSIFGVSWAVVENMGYAFVGLGAALAYLTYRVFVPALFAAPAALLTAFPAIPFIVLMRDIVKFPFFIFAILLTLLLLRRNLSFKWLLVASLTAGVAFGIGYGFRPDILIMIPVLLMALVCSACCRPWRIHRFVLPGCLFLASFFVVSLPSTNPGDDLSGCHAHFALLGLAEQFTDALGDETQPYHWTLYFSDEKIHENISAYRFRQTGFYLEEYCTPTYNAVGLRYLSDILLTFPQDMLERGYLTMKSVMVFGVKAQLDTDTFRATGIPILNQLIGLINLSIYLAWVTVFAILLVFNRIVFVTAGAIFLYVTFYPAVQFHPRHHYHLAFLSFLPFVVLAGLATEPLKSAFAVAQPYGRQGMKEVRYWIGPVREFRIHKLRALLESPDVWRVASERASHWFGLIWAKLLGCVGDKNSRMYRLRRASLYLAPVIAVFASALIVMFFIAHWQAEKTRDLFGSYLAAPTKPATLSVIDATKYQVSWPDELLASPARLDHFLRLDLGGHSCTRGDYQIETIILGDTDDPNYRYGKVVSWAGGGGDDRISVFRPFYYRPVIASRILMDLGDTPSDCLRGVSWVESNSLPALWLYAEINPEAE